MTSKINSIKLLLILLFLIPLFACEDESFILNDNKLVLPALRERSATHFNNGTRDFYTLISDSNAFNVIYPGTNKSCGYIIRYYFYTNIFLNNEVSLLISMDGSKFDVSTSNDIIMQTKNMISIINGMSFGWQEYRDFISKYPNAK
tara:strand:+ start:291 stop:728 length:438 start_codon:yes stop_codon:yes gene_type:complete